MEQITKIDGKYYYGNQVCTGPEDIYRRFRDDYNAGVGRAAYRRLSRLGSRKERVHEFGFVFDKPADKSKVQLDFRFRLSLLGLVCGSYCWIADCSFIPEDCFDEWTDIILSKGSGLMWKTGKGVGTGRKDKRLNVKYR